jgi:Transcriptional regulator, AbiEi antitoxin
MSRTLPSKALADIGPCQRGLITRAQVITAGFDDDDLRRAVRSGWLVRAGYGLYQVAGVRANDEL